MRNLHVSWVFPPDNANSLRYFSIEFRLDGLYQFENVQQIKLSIVHSKKYRQKRTSINGNKVKFKGISSNVPFIINAAAGENIHFFLLHEELVRVNYPLFVRTKSFSMLPFSLQSTPFLYYSLFHFFLRICTTEFRLSCSSIKYNELTPLSRTVRQPITTYFCCSFEENFAIFLFVKIEKKKNSKKFQEFISPNAA